MHDFRENRWSGGGDDRPYLGIMVGNSRLHWAVLGLETGEQSAGSGQAAEGAAIPAIDVPHLTAALPRDRWLPYLHSLSFPAPSQSWLRSQPQPPPLLLACVNPPQSAYFAAYPQLTTLKLQDVPLGKPYPGLGLDRALALWGAGQHYGWPVLVIDGGTGLTVTGGDRERNLVGGAILPGLRLQWRSLHERTAKLPMVQWSLDQGWPDRWARSPQEAIASGVLYSVLGGLGGFVQDWERQFGASAIVFTGGDGPLLGELFRQQALARGEAIDRLHLDSHLVFRGMGELVRSGLTLS